VRRQIYGYLLKPNLVSRRRTSFDTKTYAHNYFRLNSRWRRVVEECTTPERYTISSRSWHLSTQSHSGSGWYCFHSAVKSSETPILGAWIGISKLNRRKIKFARIPKRQIGSPRNLVIKYRSRNSLRGWSKIFACTLQQAGSASTINFKTPRCIRKGLRYLNQIWYVDVWRHSTSQITGTSSSS